MSADAEPGVEPVLTEVGTAGLERILAGLRGGSLAAPVTRAALIAFGVTRKVDALVDVLGGHSAQACIAVLHAVIAERRKLIRPVPELVWTGPEGCRATARDTAVVLRSLFENAQRRVLLAGYSFDNPEAMLGPLHAVMAARGVQAVFFVDIEQPSTVQDDEGAYGHARLEAFREASWPFDRPQYLLLNLAIGGSWGGQKGIDDTIFPQRLLVDYVRVYERR